MKIVLYTIHCGKCNVLEKKLSSLGIKFDIVDDEDLMIEKGFTSSPMLEVDGKLMDFYHALDWIKTGAINNA